MKSVSATEARQILAEADLVVAAEHIDRALTTMAQAITARLENAHPVMLTVMNGGYYLAGQLLPRLGFPLECDYLHATRYRNSTQGYDIEWRVAPQSSLEGRTVLVLDDILDEGLTLAAVKARLLEYGAAECLTAVLALKEIGRPQPIAADFVGVTVPDRYVFGCGMDVRGAWRNLPAIYAVKGL